MRLFVSVDLPDALAEAIAAVQAPLEEADGLRTTDPTQAHVTLKFLGEVDPERVPALETALTEAVTETGLEPFPVRVGGLGVFPSLEYISVVWVGVEEGASGLATLHEAVESRLNALGFEPEDHSFTPHVTVARMDDARSKALVTDLVRERDPSVGTMTVERVSLTESTLERDGPRYSTVHEVPLE